jgi:heat shock protein HslJ
MKRFLFAIFAVAAIAFVGCNKDDESSEQFDYDKELLYGTWDIVKFNGANWTLTPTSATFNSDGTYIGAGYFGNGSGTYRLSGKRITTYVDGEKYMWYDVVSLDGETAELLVNDEFTITCEKR